MNGMHADGSKATGFKSMVVAQFTGLSLQKDDRAFVRYNSSTGNYDVATAGDGAHLDGFAGIVKDGDTSTLSVQMIRLFRQFRCLLLDMHTHFTALSGGDMSITNSNSNFGNTALRSAGFKAKSFSKDKAAEITHIIPPKSLGVISTTATGSSGANTITVIDDGSVNGLVEGMVVSGTNIAAGATVSSFNTNTRVVTLSANNTGAVSGNVIFGEEISVNWVNIDIQRTHVINQALAGQGETPVRDYISMVTLLRHLHQHLGYKVSPSVQDKMALVVVLYLKLNCQLVSGTTAKQLFRLQKLHLMDHDVSGKDRQVK